MQFIVTFNPSPAAPPGPLADSKSEDFVLIANAAPRSRLLLRPVKRLLDGVFQEWLPPSPALARAEESLCVQLAAGVNAASAVLAVTTVAVCTYAGVTYVMRGAFLIRALRRLVSRGPGYLDPLRVLVFDISCGTVAEFEAMLASLNPGGLSPLPPNYQEWKLSALIWEIGGTLAAEYPKAVSRWARSPRRPEFSQQSVEKALRSQPAFCKAIAEGTLTASALLRVAREENTIAQKACELGIRGQGVRGQGVSAPMLARAKDSGFYLGLESGWLVRVATRVLANQA